MRKFFRRVRLFVQAMRRALHQWRSGRPVIASGPLSDARLSTCKVCPRYNPDFQSCSVCGCNTHLKAALLTEDCPEGRWSFPDITF